MALGRYVRELPFAAAIIGLGHLREKNWLVPDIDNRRIIRADELFYCCVDGYSYRRRADSFLNEMQLPPPRGNARVFLNREPPALRRIVNFGDVRAVFEEREFSIVDAAKLTTDEQIRLFASVRHLAAIHGAGVTNILYRQGAPMSALELHANTFINDDMKRMSGEFGYTYHRLARKPASDSDAPRASFHVEPSVLARALDEMLKS